MKKLSIFLAAIIMVAACAHKEKPFFIQVSDPQLGFINFSEDFSPEVPLMGKMVEKINTLNPEFVVFTGDLVHWRTNTAALDAFDSLTNLINENITVYYLPGNHDVGNEALKEDVDKFVQRYGSDRFVHRSKEYTVIGFNSSVVKAQTKAVGGIDIGSFHPGSFHAGGILLRIKLFQVTVAAGDVHIHQVAEHAALIPGCHGPHSLSKEII